LFEYDSKDDYRTLAHRTYELSWWAALREITSSPFLRVDSSILLKKWMSLPCSEVIV